MVKANTAYPNFAAGELSPKVRGRFDLPIYYNGCERLENYIVETQGPARFRPGFRFVLHTKGNKTAVLIPFQFNDSQSYMLEFTDQAMRIYRNEGIIVESDVTISGATQADPVVITATGHGYSDGDEIFIQSVVGMTELNGKTYLVANKTANTFEITDVDGTDIDGTGFTAYSSGGVGQKIVEITTPYLAAELLSLKYAQNADTMYIVHPNHEPRKLTRSSHTSWTLATFVRTADPFTGASDYPGAVAFYESRIVYGATINNPETLWFSMAPTAAGATRYDNFTTGTADDDAMIYALAPPHGKVDLVEWLAGTDKFLAVGTFGGISKVTGSQDDEAITPTSINVRPVETFGVADQMPVALGNVFIYVQRGELIIRSFEFDALADSFVSVDRNLVSDHMTETGITQIAFQEGRPDILWAVRTDGVLVGLTFKSREDVSGWQRHILGGTDVKVLSVGVVTQPSNFDQVWVVVERTINSVTRRYVEFLEDEPIIPEAFDYFTGEANETTDMETFLRAMFEKQKQYVHLDSVLTYDGTTPGSDASATLTPAAVSGTSVTFTASASVFSSSDVGRQLWKKTDDGSGYGRAEIITFNSATEVVCKVLTDFDSTDAMAAGDWYLTAKTITGLDHLEGETVGVVTDGAVHPDETVSSGSITLDYQASKVHIGLKYTGWLKTMNLEVGGLGGPAQTKPKNVHEVGIRFHNTLGAKYGTNIYKMENILFRSTAHATDRPPPLFSGDKRVSYPDTTMLNKHVIVKQEQPLPCVVQLLVPYVTTSND